MAVGCSNGLREQPRPVSLLGGTDFRTILPNTPATLSPTPVGDAHNWRVFTA